jgi:hypothetical protein
MYYYSLQIKNGIQNKQNNINVKSTARIIPSKIKSVAHRTATRQRLQDKQLYNSRC